MKKRLPPRSSILSIYICSLIGIIVSIYLTYDHFSPSERAVCDFGGGASCTVLKKSDFSSLLNVPLSIFGLIWFVLLSVCAYYSSDYPEASLALLLWSGSGLLFVVYLLLVEIYLQTLCPFCTILHVLIIYITYVSFKIFRLNKSTPNVFHLIEQFKGAFTLGVILFLLPILFFNCIVILHVDSTELINCMNESGMVVFAHSDCGTCQQQHRILSDTVWSSINKIECKQDKDFCTYSSVDDFPTFVIFNQTFCSIVFPTGQEIQLNKNCLSVENQITRQVGLHSRGELYQFCSRYREVNKGNL
eukprot:TRINITY_DN2011_c0_g1_i1.p1 TRINITY_DN2011_c0_g1~~TRINITY_DN2011_c0_g1_i1.p1  ORF type:complete len:313 (-),score=43.91 TRINITY_DN2011_c0_g1_i1:3-911(-)